MTLAHSKSLIPDKSSTKEEVRKILEAILKARKRKYIQPRRLYALETGNDLADIAQD